jgi:hypothetical protein
MACNTAQLNNLPTDLSTFFVEMSLKPLSWLKIHAYIYGILRLTTTAHRPNSL